MSPNPTHLQQLRQQQYFSTQADALKAALERPTPRLNTLLVHDARSLLLTLKFSLFVQLLLAELAAQPQEVSHPTQLSADLSLWLLPSLPLPLPLRLRRFPGFDTAALVPVQMELGVWQQEFRLPVAERTDDETATQAWDTISAQLHKSRVQLPVAPDLQIFLTRELMAILTYLSEFEVEFLTSTQEQAL